MITTEDIYQRTNNGLDVIYYFYPQARACVEGTARHFRMRADERTPSATVKQINGLWRVTDFGDAGRALSPIDVCMQEKNMSFTESVFFLAREFNIDDNLITRDVNIPKIQKRPANGDEPEGHFNYELNDEFTLAELQLLGPNVKQSDCDALGWSSLKWYSLTSKGETTIITPTETYPVFMRRCQYYDPDKTTANHFYKIYQPLNHDKAYRFFYKGAKPHKYVNGLFELKASYKACNDARKRDMINSGKLGEDDTYTYEKIPEAFICSGERDALCVHALGHDPLWFNSETYNLSESEYNEMTRYAERIYNIPDIDPTGVRRGIELSSRYIDVYLVWLPDALRTYRDRRGHPRKDFRDYCEIWPEKRNFRDLLNLAMPFRFWEYRGSRDQRRLELVYDYAMHFLKCNGFHTLEDKNATTGKMFIHAENNVVREIRTKDIHAYFRKFVRDRYMPIDIRELVNNTTKLSDSAIARLDETRIDFTNHTPTTQYFFFKNEIWEATPQAINVHKLKTINLHVWENEQIQHHVKRLEPAFEVSRTDRDSQPSWDISVSPNHGSNFFRFLINASRIFWRKELENPLLSVQELDDYAGKYPFTIDGPALDAFEIEEQKHHLVNKIFCIGYLLHRYKAENRAWCIYAMDNKEGSIDESNGGTGKSFCFKTPRQFMQSVTLSGRNPKLTENKHIFENVTEHTKYILIDDSDAYTNFTFFFDSVTGDLLVNPKNTKSYSIPFEICPKFCITSNYVLRNIDPSVSRRILYAVFSDYYHEKTPDNDYRETRTIYDDFHKNLFREAYTEDEWNADINFLVECCQFYLSVIKDDVKLQPPMNNVRSRNLRGVMGEAFLEWAQVYFSEDSTNFNRFISRSEMFKDFKDESGLNKYTPQKFSKAIKAFCDYNPYTMELNPAEHRGKDGRIIHSIDGKAAEMYYIKHIPNAAQEPSKQPDGAIETTGGATEITPDVPF